MRVTESQKKTFHSCGESFFVLGCLILEKVDTV